MQKDWVELWSSLAAFEQCQNPKMVTTMKTSISVSTSKRAHKTIPRQPSSSTRHAAVFSWLLMLPAILVHIFFRARLLQQFLIRLVAYFGVTPFLAQTYSRVPGGVPVVPNNICAHLLIRDK
ncbi:hypothetical protein FA95DRAFT_1684691, partial [Auriscalpium vulgare]